MTDIAELGYAVDSRQLKTATAALHEMAPAAKSAELATDRLSGSMTKAQSRVQAFTSTLERMAFKIGSSIGKQLRDIATGFAAIFAIRAVIQTLEQTAQRLDDVSKAARAVGSSVAEMQALAAAGDLAGVGVDALAASTRRMNRVLGDAIAKGKGTEGVFARLKISAQELEALPIDQRFALIADQMQKLGFSSADATAALALLGDRGGNLIGLLGEGGDQIRQAAADVEKFHLAISDVDGSNIEAMNDNFTRLGYAVQGALNQFIAFVAPAFSALFLGIANAIAFVVENFHVLGTVLQVIGPALLLIFGPQLLGLVLTLTIAIGSGLVGAFEVLTTVILANPLGALAVAIVTIISAVWTFRDTIKTVFGVDVEAIVKGTANAIVRYFFTAMADLRFIWNNFPTIVGAAVTGAVNAVIDGINFMIAGAASGLNDLLLKISQIPGLGIAAAGMVDPKTIGNIDKLTDSYTGLLTTASAARDAEVLAIQATDYFAGVAGSATAVSDASSAATDSVNGLGSALDGVSAKGSGVSSVLKGVAAAAKDVADGARSLGQEIAQSLSGAFKGFFKDLMHGKSLIDSVGDALSGLADKAMDMVLNGIFDQLFGMLGSAIGGGLSGGSIGLGKGWFGNARGGVYQSDSLHSHINTVVSRPTAFAFARGAGIMGEAGPEAIMPLARGPDGKLGVKANNDNGGGLNLDVTIINNASNDVEANASISDGKLIVMIDKLTAGNVGNRGSQTHKALKGTFGLSGSTKSR